MTATLEEVKKLCYDLKAKVDENITPKETLIEMVTAAVDAQLTNQKTPGDDMQFEEIPEPQSLLKRFDINHGNTLPDNDGAQQSASAADQILRANNVKTNLQGQPTIYTDQKTGLRTLAVIDERLEALQRCADDLMIIHACMRISGPSSYRSMSERDQIRSLKSYRKWEQLTEGLKSQLDSTTAGGADEWVPTNFSNQLTDAIVLSHQVAALFPLINTPTEPFTIPTQTAKPMASVVAEGVAPSEATLGAGKPTTANKSLATKIFKYFLDFTDEVVEDSIIAMIPYIRSWITLAMVRGEETMIVNGDATGAHMDSDITLGEQPQKAFDALRQFGSSNIFATGNPDPFTADAIRNTRALLSVGFRENPSDLVYITSGLGLLNMLQIAEILTLDKVGPMATILNGQLAQFDGSPVVISEHVREDLNASAVEDGVTTDRTIVICAHRASFVRGSRRDPRVEVDKTIKTSVNTMVVSMRRGFLDVQDSGTFNNVAIAGNIS